MGTMEQPGNPDDLSKEKFSNEYIKKVLTSAESGELEPMLAESTVFKAAFAAIIKESGTPAVAIQKISTLVAEEAPKVDVSMLQRMVDEPHLFQALFVAKKKNESDTFIGSRTDWMSQSPGTASEENEIGALLQSFALAYISKDLDTEARKDFIATSVPIGSANGVGRSRLVGSPHEAIYDVAVTEGNNAENLAASAKAFLKAALVGKKVDIFRTPDVDPRVKKSFSNFYATFGNQVQSFVNAVVSGELFKYDTIERGLRDAVYYKQGEDDIKREAAPVMTYYRKQLGLSEDAAKERIVQKFGVRL
ncbi:MAG: hypothetical protein WCF77_03445 [Minisyncoccia bacterium]